MKICSLKIYLLKAAFIRRGVPILVIAIFIAIFCMPKISSLAYHEITTSDYFSPLRNIIGLNFEPEIYKIKLSVTAYNSTIGQTDSTPCITASGYNLCKHDKENVVATNYLPFGTKIRFPELDPHKIYTVVDRMNERYNARMDIWMKSKEEARSFGMKYLTVEVFK